MTIVMLFVLVILNKGTVVVFIPIHLLYLLYPQAKHLTSDF